MPNLELTVSGGKPKPLAEGRITIGRDASNDLVFDDGAVSGFHAEIHCDSDRTYIVDLGSTNGTVLNGKKVEGRIDLKAWDKIKIGPQELEVIDPSGRRPTQVAAAVTDENLDKVKATDPEATKVRPAVSGLSLEGVSKEVSGKSHSLGGALKIGRDADNDIVIPQQGVSRHHATISVSGSDTIVKDEGSTNGTFVNGKKVASAKLKGGDTLRIDDVEFRVVGGPTSSAATQVRPSVSSATKQSKSPNATTQMPGVSAVALVGVSPEIRGKRFTLSGHEVKVGRSASAGIVLSDNTVSSSHAVLKREAGKWSLEDLGSTNGTKVNGKSTKRASLANGDQITFGQVELKFESAQVGSSTQALGTSSTQVVPVPGIKGKLQTLPGWAVGAASFVLVLLIASGFFWITNEDRPTLTDMVTPAPEQIEAPLQLSDLWTRQIPDGQSDPLSPALADVNGDNVLDAIIVTASGRLLILDGEEGKQIIFADLPGRYIAAPVAVDLTNDSIPEVVVANRSGIISAYTGGGDLLWRSASDLGLGEIVNRPAIGQINDDNIPDLLFPTENKGLVAIDGSRGWEIWNTESLIRGSIISAPIGDDLNDDGAKDFVVLTNAGQALAVSVSGERVLRLWEADTAASGYGSPAIFDSVSGKTVVVPGDNGTITALNGSTGRALWSANMAGGVFASPVANDFNGDGQIDIVVATLSGRVSVLTGAFGDDSLWIYENGAAIAATPILFDLSNDGVEDIILSDANGRVFALDGVRGRVLAEVSLGSAIQATPVLGDFNSNQFLGLLAATQSGAIRAFDFNRTVRAGRAIWPEFLHNQGVR